MTLPEQLPCTELAACGVAVGNSDSILSPGVTCRITLRGGGGGGGMSRERGREDVQGEREGGCPRRRMSRERGRDVHGEEGQRMSREEGGRMSRERGRENT